MGSAWYVGQGQREEHLQPLWRKRDRTLGNKLHQL